MASPAFVRHQAEPVRGDARRPEYRAAAARFASTSTGPSARTGPGTRSSASCCCPTRTTRRQKGAGEFLRPRVADLDQLTNDVSVAFFGVNCQLRPVPRPPAGEGLEAGPLLRHEVVLRPHLRQRRVPRASASTASVKFKPTKGPERHGEDDVPDRHDGRRRRREGADQGRSRRRRRSSSTRPRRTRTPPPPPAFSARAKLVEVALQPKEREFFARSIVNRLWHRFFGYGLVKPLDQMHSREPAEPPGTARLAGPRHGRARATTCGG